MKRDLLTKYHQMPLEELHKERFKLEQNIGEVKLKISLGKQKNTSLKKTLRHDLAQINTLISAKIYSQKIN